MEPRMEPEDLLQSFPSSWRRLLTAEHADFNSCGVEGAERWLLATESSFQEGTMATNSQPPDWASILDYLTQDGMMTVTTGLPDIAAQSSTDQLHKTCRFSKLPVHIQRTLLGLISQHASEIPLASLQRLIKLLQDGFLTDHWSRFHLHTLQNFIATFLPKPEGERSKGGQRTTPGVGLHSTCVHTSDGFVSERSKQLFDEVCKSVGKKGHGDSDKSFPQDTDKKEMLSSYTDITSFYDWWSDDRKQSQGAVTTENRASSQEQFFPENIPSVLNAVPFSLKREGISLGDVPQFELEHAGMSDPKRPCTDASESPVQPPPVLDDCMLDAIGAETPFPKGVEEGEENGSSGSRHVDNVGVVKRTEQGRGAEEKSVHSETESGGKGFIDSLSTDIKTQLDRLRSSWSDEGTTGTVERCDDVVQLMASCSMSQLTELSDYFCLGDLSCGALPAVCQTIVQQADIFSFTSAFLLAEKIFLGKLASLSQRPARPLTSALSDYTQAFPKPAIEGALMPCLVHQDASSVQFDLVSKVAKEALTNDHMVYLLRKLLTHPTFIWSECMSGFVQSLLDAKLECDPSILNLLTASLGQNGTSQAQCKKYAKLLLAVINKYNKQMTSESVANLQRAVMVNQTFLRKACQASLNRIKL